MVLPENLYETLQKEEEEGDIVSHSQKNLLLSLGAFSVVIFGLIALLILYYVITCCVNPGRICCDSLGKELGKFLFFDAFIRYMIESFLDFAYENISYVNLHARYDTQLDVAFSWMRIIFVMITSIWILFTIVWPLLRFSRLRDP